MKKNLISLSFSAHPSSSLTSPLISYTFPRRVRLVNGSLLLLFFRADNCSEFLQTPGVGQLDPFHPYFSFSSQLVSEISSRNGGRQETECIQKLTGTGLVFRFLNTRKLNGNIDSGGIRCGSPVNSSSRSNPTNKKGKVKGSNAFAAHTQPVQWGKFFLVPFFPFISLFSRR